MSDETITEPIENVKTCGRNERAGSSIDRGMFSITGVCGVANSVETCEHRLQPQRDHGHQVGDSSRRRTALLMGYKLR